METLQRIREYELNRVLPLLSRGGRILEIGAGAGWQARTLSERGFTVAAVDTEAGGYEDVRIWPVLTYDGHRLPFADGSFDVVFSSNVLEHIAEVEEFQTEIKRVLKPGGSAVHVLPSATWCVWTGATYYVVLLRNAFTERTWRGVLYHIRVNRCPPRHGERGTFLSEIFLFRKAAWLRLFAATGWEIEKSYPNRLFYTGYSVFDRLIPFRSRPLLSYALGSSCNIICLRKPGSHGDDETPA